MANQITVSRFPLLLLFIVMLYSGGPVVRLISVPLLFIFLMLDTVDGIIARRTGTTSLLGSVLDIAADRTYELVLWVCLADLRVIPVAIPLIVIVRTTLTDALRSIGVSKGQAPFEQQRSRLGRFIVGSPWMRTSYSVSKIVAFCGLTLGIAFSSFPNGDSLALAAGVVLDIFRVVAWIAVAICVVRGMPVIVGAIRRSLRPEQPAGEPSAP
ncbi:MAG TPA: CDP-alcohol phosphatidyltransferase family protein [Anaerolineales bacterium]|nr:CDP-alcohol phosphatidyltransferase family protein [Anaerolineales bacterium]